MEFLLSGLFLKFHPHISNMVHVVGIGVTRDFYAKKLGVRCNHICNSVYFFRVTGVGFEVS